MQILRIILMVCFVFTVYPSIGEAQNSGVGIKKGGEASASDPLTIETTSQALRPELPLGMDDTVDKLGGNDSDALLHVGEFEPNEALNGDMGYSANESTHLNERILQLQKKELDKSIDTPTEDDGY